MNKQGPAWVFTRTVDKGAKLAALHDKPGNTLIMTDFTHFVGIDISKNRLDVHSAPDNRTFSVGNTEVGIADLLAQTAQEGVAYGCEATGGHEATLLVGLSEAGRSVWCLHPADVAAHKRLIGRRAKTDPLDARAIADATAAVCTQKPPTQLTRSRRAIKELSRVRRGLSQQCTTLASLAAAADDAVALDTVERLLASLKTEINALSREIERRIQSDTETARTAELIRSVPGAGAVLAAELIASMPEIGAVSSRVAASLSGVAPHPRQSGNTARTGRCTGGRAVIRRILYMGVMSLIAADSSSFSAKYRALRAAGKPHKVAAIAIARKLIVAINTVLKRGTPWEPFVA